MRFGSVVALGPPTKMAITTSSNETRKLKIAAAAIDSRMDGSVTCRNVRQ
jgi:hypothetical protein